MSECRTPRRWSSQEVMDKLFRSDQRPCDPDGGTSGAMRARGLKDTSSRPAKDLGGTLRHTIRTMLRSYDSRASGDQKCPHRQGCVANVAKNNRLNQESCTHLLLATADRNVGTAFFSKSDTMRWQLRLPAHSCDFESHNHILDRKGEHLWKN